MSKPTVAAKNPVPVELKAREEKKQLRRAAKLAEKKDESVKTAVKRGRPKKEVKLQSFIENLL